jgi:hypothetical protein
MCSAFAISETVSKETSAEVRIRNSAVVQVRTLIYLIGLGRLTSRPNLDEYAPDAFLIRSNSVQLELSKLG